MIEGVTTDELLPAYTFDRISHVTSTTTQCPSSGRILYVPDRMYNYVRDCAGNDDNYMYDSSDSDPEITINIEDTEFNLDDIMKTSKDECVSKIFSNKNYKSQREINKEKTIFLETASMEDKKQALTSLWKNWSPVITVSSDNNILPVSANTENADGKLIEQKPVMPSNSTALPENNISIKCDITETINHPHHRKYFKVYNAKNKVILKQNNIPFKLRRVCEYYLNKELDNEMYKPFLNDPNIDVDNFLHPFSQKEPIPAHLLGKYDFTFDKILLNNQFGCFTLPIKNSNIIDAPTTIMKNGRKVFDFEDNNVHCVNDYLMTTYSLDDNSKNENFFENVDMLKLQYDDNLSMLNKPPVFRPYDDDYIFMESGLNMDSVTDLVENHPNPDPCRSSDVNDTDSGYDTDNIPLNETEFSSNKPVFDILKISDKYPSNLTNKINRLSNTLDKKFADHEIICGEYGTIEVGIDQYDESSTIYTIDHRKKVTKGREFYKNILGINCQIKGNSISAELDTGSAYNIMGLKTISRLDKEWETKFRKTEFNTPLKGVSGKPLNIVGAFIVPVRFPLIGVRNLNIKVITDQDLFLIGREFLTANNVTISFHPSKYVIKFGKSITNVTINQSNVIDFVNGIGQTTIDASTIDCLPGNYVVTMVDSSSGDMIDLQMPDQLVKINEKRLCNIKLISHEYVTCSSFIDFTVNLSRINGEDEIISTETDIDIKDISNGFQYIPTSYTSIHQVPDELKYLYDHINEDFCPVEIRNILNDMPKIEQECNTICIECITHKNILKLTVPELLALHKDHDDIEFGSDKCVKFVSSIIEKEKNERQKKSEMISKINISKESENIEFDLTEDKDFAHLDRPNGADLVPGELGVPMFKSEAMIKQSVEKRIQNLPIEVQNILIEPLIRNESMSVNPWDIPPVKGEYLHYELKEVPKNTKVYPVKKEDLKTLYSTLQFLLFYKICDRAPIDKNFGSPTFLIKRKATSTESSRAPRLLIDARDINNSIRGTRSASMVSCYDQLRDMAAGTKFLSSIDLTNMFYSLKNSPELVESGAVNFTTVYGVFRLLRSLQGGALSPAFANNVIMKRLNLDSQGIPSYLDSVFSFYDDINLTSGDHKTIIDHASDLADLLNRVNQIGFMINMEKSKFCVDLVNESIEILGLKISRNTISATEKRKKDIIEQLQTPRDKTSLQRLIGLLNYLRNLMQADDLRNLNILSTKLKNAKLNWDEEGEKCLVELKQSLMTRDFNLNIPDSEYIPLLFSDASDHCAAGVLYYLKIDSIIDTEAQYPNIKQSEALKNHNEHFNIATTPLTEKVKNILEFVCEVFYHYNSSDVKRNDHVLSLIVGSLLILMPQLLHKMEYDTESNKEKNYRELLRNISNQNSEFENQISAHELILHGLAHAMRRQIVLIPLIDGYKNTKPFICLTGDCHLSPILILYESGEYQLLALMKNDFGYRMYSTKTIEDLSGNEILKLFRQNSKENKLLFGGVYSFSLPDSYKSVAIYLKELLALSSSLSYWSSYLKMQKCLIFIDSSTVLYGLKNVKSKGLNKLHRIGISLSHGFPLARVFLVPSKINPSDHYSRIHENDNNILDSPNHEMQDFVNLYVNSNESTKLRDTMQFVDNNCDENTNNGSNVNLIGGEDIRELFDPAPTYESILKFTSLYHKDMVETENNKYINGFYVNQHDQIYLPRQLWLNYILYTHAINHHPGHEKTYTLLQKEFFVESTTGLKKLINETLQSCIACGEAKSSFFKSYRYMSSYGGEILNSISIDVIESTKYFQPQQNLAIHSVLGVLCNVSRYFEIFYLSSGHTNEIVNSLLSFFSKHRIPKYLYADNGATLRSKKVYHLCNCLNITYTRSSPYASKARGKVENMFKQLRSASRIFNSYYPGTNELLSFLYFIRVYNNTPLPLKNINVTPAFLANFPYSECLSKINYESQITNNFSKILKSVNSETLVQEQLDMKKLYDTAIKCIQKSVELHNTKVNKHRFDHKFQIGDLVLGRNFSRTRKCQPIYNRDILRIIEINGSMFVLQSLVTGLTLQRHVLHIKNIKLISDESINAALRKKFGLYTQSYIEELINQYKNDKKKEEKMQILTRSKSKKQDEEIRQKVEMDDSGDEDLEVSFRDENY